MPRFWKEVPKKPGGYVPLEEFADTKSPNPEEILALTEQLRKHDSEMKPEVRSQIIEILAAAGQDISALEAGRDRPELSEEELRPFLDTRKTPPQTTGKISRISAGETANRSRFNEEAEKLRKEGQLAKGRGEGHYGRRGRDKNDWKTTGGTRETIKRPPGLPEERKP